MGFVVVVGSVVVVAVAVAAVQELYLEALQESLVHKEE